MIRRKMAEFPHPSCLGPALVFTQPIHCLLRISHLAHLLVAGGQVVFTVAISEAEKVTGCHCPRDPGKGD